MDARRRAAERVKKERRKQEIAPRIDGCKSSGIRRQKPLTAKKNAWNNRHHIIDSDPTGLRPHSAAPSRRRSALRSRSRQQIKTLTERADGDAIISFERREIVRKNALVSPAATVFMTETASSPINPIRNGEILLEVCNSTGPTDAAAASTPNTTMNLEERKAKAVEELERRLYELETAEEMIMRSLEDSSNDSQDGCIMNLDLGPSETCNEKSMDDAKALADAKIEAEEDDTQLPPTNDLPTLSKDVKRDSLECSRDINCNHNGRDEPLPPTKLIDLAVERIVDDEIKRLADEMKDILVGCVNNRGTSP